MTKSRSFCTDARRWKAAFREAVLETDRYTIPRRISEAEEAIIARRWELSQDGRAEVEIERDALEQALYSLRALRNAAENTISAGASSGALIHNER